jgi:16S rRNA (guanine527-N7)-methyltransferase
VPGLVIAHDRPDLRLTLIDRRTKRTDFLARVVRRLGWAERVDVVSGDVGTFAETNADRFDAAVARGFGPPEMTLRLAIDLVRRGGRVVISEPPDGDRWTESPLVASRIVTRLADSDGLVSFRVET